MTDWDLALFPERVDVYKVDASARDPSSAGVVLAYTLDPAGVALPCALHDATPDLVPDLAALGPGRVKVVATFPADPGLAPQDHLVPYAGGVPRWTYDPGLPPVAARPLVVVRQRAAGIGPGRLWRADCTTR
jgi:hypothetical protein